MREEREEAGLAEDTAALLLFRQLHLDEVGAVALGGREPVERGQIAVDEGVVGVEDVAIIAVLIPDDVVDEVQRLLAHRLGELG